MCMATYLGWRTGLCCHHGWPETSLPLSGTSETVKHNTNSHTFSLIALHCVSRQSKSTYTACLLSVLNVVGYYNFSNGTNPKTSCILLPNICLSASVTTRNSIGFQRYRYEWIMCPLFIIYSFISYFLAKWSWLTVNCWSPRGRQNVCVRSRLLTWIVREKQQVLSSRQRLVC